LPHPREVILRDETAPPDAQARRRTAAPPPPPVRRPPANPLRPARPRTLIQKVEPRIQTLPTTERATSFEAAASADAPLFEEPIEILETREEAQPAPAAPEPEEQPAAAAPVAAPPA